MTSGQSPVDFRVGLAHRLRRLMQDKSVTAAEIRAALDCSPSKVSKLLRGDHSIRHAELVVLLDLFEVGSTERADLLHLGEEARRRRPKTPWGTAVPDRLRKYFDTEETARRIELYRPDLVHGLAQTEAYARAVIRTNPALTPDEVEHLVQARLARQVRLTGPNPVEYVMVIRQEVLGRPVGSPETRFEQLRHLRGLSELPHVTIRVIPDEAGLTSALFFPFEILTGQRGKTVYVETLTDGLLVDEESRISHYEAVFRDLVAVSRTDLLDSVGV